ncbi:MAG TPA: hypothetical protein PKY81_07415 [bacterium]|nr:hypothetical protein [bacterium]
MKKILLAGIGGCGNNVVSYIFDKDKSFEFLAINTDSDGLNKKNLNINLSEIGYL